MFTSLRKGNKKGDTAMAMIGFTVRVKYRDDSYMKKQEFVELTYEEFLTLCKKTIKKGFIRKEDL